MKIICLIFILIIFCSGCFPDRFILNSRSFDRQFGRILDGLDSFEQINDNSFKLKSGKVSVRSYEFTQHAITFNYKVIEGDTLKIALRTVDYLYNGNSGITFKIYNNGMEISENGKIIKRSDNIKLTTGIEHYVNIRNAGKLLKFQHDCDDITLSTELPATEFIIFSVPEKSELFVSGLNFEKLFQNNLKTIINF